MMCHRGEDEMEIRRADWLVALPLRYRAVLESAAVLEQFDAAALEAVVREPVQPLLQRMRDEDLVRWEGTQSRIDPTVQVAVLATLETTPARSRDLYERSTRWYETKLAETPGPDRGATEQIYMRHLERWCEVLLQQEPTALAGVVSTVPWDLLTEPASRHLVDYYRGLSAGLNEHFTVAHDVFDRLLAEPQLEDTIRARVLNSEAVFARIQGDYERARQGYHASQVLWERLGNRMRQGLALMNQGVLRYYVQDYGAAEQDLLQSLHIFREIEAGHAQAMALTNLGLVARDQGHWEKALNYLQQAADLFEHHGSRDFLGRVSNNIGEVAMLRGQFDVALEYFQRALTQMTTRVYAVDVHVNMGLVSQAQGDQWAALDQYHAALNLAQELGRREIAALLHYRSGYAEQALAQRDAAQMSYAAAIEVIEDTRTPIRDEGLSISLMGRWQQVYETAAQLAVARGDHATAFNYAERARARAFADVLARRGADLGDARSAPLTVQEVQAALPDGTLLLSYFATGLRDVEWPMINAMPQAAAALRACLVTPPQLLLFAVTSTELRAHLCTINPNLLQPFSPYQNDGQRFLSNQILRRLHATLIAPVGDMLEQAKRVVIVPHGPLHQLPFAALPDAEGRPLLERVVRLSYAPSATVLLRTQAPRRSPALKPCLALGYNGAAQHNLRYTEPEAQAIAAMCGGEFWRGSTGVCRRLQEAAGQYRWLHFACHGEFDHDDPLHSWLEIGPDEHLAAADIVANVSLQADLVVLSACRSGVSRVLRGDEPMGLVRALLCAGARAVLLTLWPVEDRSARLLMERFYAALIEHGPAVEPAAALRIAQQYLRQLMVADVRALSAHWHDDLSDLAALDSAARPYADPAFWAAYVLVGGSVPAFISN
jgi:CHAT domain-containing protein/tetratricopeptide (TPR) repeat protein